MVYESDFYTSRRYRPTPNLSTYTSNVGTIIVPSRHVKVLPALGKVHVINSYVDHHTAANLSNSNAVLPYVRTTAFPTSPAKLAKEYQRIENRWRCKPRHHAYFSATSRYLDSDSAVLFDDETRLIRAQTASLLRRVQSPVPRIQKQWPITTYRFESHLPARLSNDNYIYKMLTPTTTTYIAEPTRRYIGGPGHLSCVSYAGGVAYPRRRNVWLYEDPVRNDIQLLSYYIQKFRNDRGGSTGSSGVKIREVLEEEKIEKKAEKVEKAAALPTVEQPSE